LRGEKKTTNGFNGNFCKLLLWQKQLKRKATKNPNKYDITVKTNLTADELFKLAINTPPKKK
jgi:hypothetical protein